MKIIYNSLIPFKGFLAINLFGVIFARKGNTLSSRVLNHERIHTAQMRELLYVPFYLIYLLEWIFRLIFCSGNAYRNLSFEKEAFENDSDFSYLARRPRFTQWRINQTAK